MRVLIVDDMARARKSLRALLATCPEVESVDEAVDGRQAVGEVAGCCPDVVVMDACMTEMDGLEATRQIKARWPHVKVFVISMYADYEEGALAAGADAFVTKGEPVSRLLGLLQTVATTHR